MVVRSCSADAGIEMTGIDTPYRCAPPERVGGIVAPRKGTLNKALMGGRKTIEWVTDRAI